MQHRIATTRSDGGIRSRAGSLALCVLLCAAQSAAQSKEVELKAQMIRKMIPYVTWPKGTFAGTKKVITIGVIGKSVISKALETACKDVKVKGCRVRVVRFASWRKIKDTKPVLSCHVLFVSRSEKRSLPKILAAVRKRPILLLSHSPGFAKLGTHINFFLAESKVAFETHATSARLAGIRLSSKLLRLGRRVD